MFELNVASQMNYIPWKHSPVTKTIDYIRGGATVLDVGCADGYVGRALKEKGCKVYGIEIDATAAEMARRDYKEVILCDVEEKEVLPFADGFFDYIICLDILEHLKRPDGLLYLLKRYINKKSGQLIISLPNIARFEVRLQLLFGKFVYENWGIKSKGHLRFFTKSTALALIEDAGYRLRRIEYTGLASIIKVFPTLTSYQFLITAVV